MSVFLTNSTWKMTEAAIKALTSKDVNVIAGDTSQRLNIFSRTNFVRYSSPKHEGFVQSLYQIIENSDVEVLFPMSNDTVVKISENKKLFGELCEVPVPDYEILLRAHDKLKTARLAESLGIPVPKTYFFDKIGSLISFSESANYPLIVKPRMGGGASVYLYKVESKDELLTAYNSNVKNYGPPIIQEYIPGGSEQMRLVDLLFDKKSTPVAALTAKKVREYPVNKGTMTCGVSTYEPELIDLAIKLLKGWSWYGAAEVELKIDPRDGVPKLIEVNPRFWQHLQLSIASGVNLPYMLYKVALNEEIQYLPHYKVGLKYINPVKDFLSVTSIFRNGFVPKNIKDVIDSYKGEKTYSIHNRLILTTIFGEGKNEDFN